MSNYKIILLGIVSIQIWQSILCQGKCGGIISDIGKNVLILDYNSLWDIGDSSTYSECSSAVCSPEACEEICKSVDGCNLWVYCDNAYGCPNQYCNEFGCGTCSNCNDYISSMPEFPFQTQNSDVAEASLVQPDMLPINSFGPHRGCVSNGRWPAYMCSLKSVKNINKVQMNFGYFFVSGTLGSSSKFQAPFAMAAFSSSSSPTPITFKQPTFPTINEPSEPSPTPKRKKQKKNKSPSLSQPPSNIDIAQPPLLPASPPIPKLTRVPAPVKNVNSELPALLTPQQEEIQFVPTPTYESDPSPIPPTPVYYDAYAYSYENLKNSTYSISSYSDYSTQLPYESTSPPVPPTLLYQDYYAYTTYDSISPPLPPTNYITYTTYESTSTYETSISSYSYNTYESPLPPQPSTPSDSYTTYDYKTPLEPSTLVYTDTDPYATYTNGQGTCYGQSQQVVEGCTKCDSESSYGYDINACYSCVMDDSIPDYFKADCSVCAKNSMSVGDPSQAMSYCVDCLKGVYDTNIAFACYNMCLFASDQKKCSDCVVQLSESDDIYSCTYL